MMRPASDLAALQHGVDVTLSLTPLEAVLGHDLGYEIVLALERGQILVGELAPLRSDFLENHLPGLCGGLGFGSRCIRSYVGHVSTSKKIQDKKSFEWSLFKRQRLYGTGAR